MNLYYWESNSQNFGDELNKWLWRTVAPDLFMDKNDGILFVGLGTILNNNLPHANITVVFGSGAGYGAPPKFNCSNRWHYYAVRGPLTAYALGLDATVACSDPAVWLPQVFSPHAISKKNIIFVPHWETAESEVWKESARIANIELVDPRGDPLSVISQIAAAKLVLAESLHAAIVADAYRVPWVPVICSHASLFKWMDWTMSLDIPYNPVCLFGPIKTGLLNKIISLMIEGRIKRQASYISKRFSSAVPISLLGEKGAQALTPNLWRNLLPTALGRLREEAIPIRKELVESSAEEFLEVARKEGQLSADKSLKEVQEKLFDRLHQLELDYHNRGRSNSALNCRRRL